ncbi:MAG: hypothetical protein A2X28_02640 [Elusimicrobia bacterium GWA2_56_46]|nr:MAG: hypothetical protein A2X28_02640 [Elusimicrobia bacterium GWA2_56_46]OGR55341.1 MAG: hypothetical protein A2X39_00325 [Elusimicrobia bacterium GWC2_56_31]HBB67575.1 hypothetical protein [Elusimicrobiota bacterium]HBW23123.1 hypothetical protein [Elusimicrobiota bacterium]
MKSDFWGRTILLAALFSGPAIPALSVPGARAQETSAAADAQPAPESRQMTLAYDEAFESYLAGNYQKAIDYWSQVLRLDPTQVTARNMIEEARKKLSGSAAGQKGKFYALVARGHYGEALLKIEEMAAVDPSSPLFSKLAGRLKKISAIAGRKPSNAKPWNIAAQGIFNFVNEEENLPFAYDAFRYAAELSPRDARFQKLTALLEEESPQLKLNDTKPAQTGVLDHKKELALHYIYDSKFYLAVRELEDTLKFEPEDTTALKRLGSTYLQLKDYPRARDTWEKALRLAPDDGQLKEYMQALDKLPRTAVRGKNAQKNRSAKPRKARPTLKP